jgi:hypothetical protein
MTIRINYAPPLSSLTVRDNEAIRVGTQVKQKTPASLFDRLEFIFTKNFF